MFLIDLSPFYHLQFQEVVFTNGCYQICMMRVFQSLLGVGHLAHPSGSHVRIRKSRDGRVPFSTMS